MRLLLLFIGFVFTSLSLNAQSDKQRALTLGYAPNVYKGDFESEQNWGNSFNIGLNLNKGKFLTGEFQLRIGSVTAQTLSNDFSSEVVKYVKTNYLGINYGLSFRVLNIKDKFQMKLTPGFGLMRFDPKSLSDEKLSSKNSTRQKGEAYGNTALMLPFKCTLEYYTKYKVSYTLSTGYLNTFTDYLDNVSKLGVSDKKDNIFFLGLGIGVDLN
jgi:hypothetical protein